MSEQEDKPQGARDPSQRGNPYSSEFRRAVLEAYKAEGYNATRTAARCGIAPSTLRQWARAARLPRLRVGRPRGEIESRREHNAAIREMLRSDTPMIEVARAFGLTYQRIQQIARQEPCRERE